MTGQRILWRFFIINLYLFSVHAFVSIVYMLRCTHAMPVETGGQLR